METTDIYENGEEVINKIKDKIILLMCNSEGPSYNKFTLYLTPAELVVLYNYLKNNNKLDELITYNLWYYCSNYIYLHRK